MRLEQIHAVALVTASLATKSHLDRKSVPSPIDVDGHFVRKAVVNDGGARNVAIETGEQQATSSAFQVRPYRIQKLYHYRQR